MSTVSSNSRELRATKGWHVEPFTEVVYDKTGGQEKIKKGDYLASGTLPVIDQGQAEIGGYTDDVSSACQVDLPCILFGDHTRLFKWADRPFALGADGVKVLSTREDLNARYAFWYLNTVYLPDNLGYSRHYKYLKRTEIPLPPLPEQKRIADILDKADAIRRKRQEVIRAAGHFPVSMFFEMFGDPQSNPKGWASNQLKKLIAKGDKVNYGVVQPGGEYLGGVPIVRVGDLKGLRVSTDGLKQIDPEIERQYVRSRLVGDEVLVACVGSIGLIALADDRVKGCNIVRAVARVRCGEKVNRQYLAAYLATPAIQSYFTQSTRTVSQPTLNIKQIEETTVLVPPIELQHEYSAIVLAYLRSLERQEAAQSATTDLFNSLVQRAFKGEL